MPFTPPRMVGFLGRLPPGLLLCAAVTLAALALERVEAAVFGRAWLEALVLAILVGTVVRTVWSPSERWTVGVSFAAKQLLELAVVLLGASLSLQTIVAAGWALLAGIAAVVVIAILGSYGAGRLLGLPHRMAVLVACGNSICGNSAIAAIAPVIGADGDDVACSIAFTAVLGVVVVLVLPFLMPVLHLSVLQYGALAGLTVYAVPQVLAATAPIGPLAIQLGTLVKLVRVLMLGPVVLTLSLTTRRRQANPAGRLAMAQLIPWFILGFLVLAAVRSAGLLPVAVLAPTAWLTNLLTIVAMAALGLGTNLRTVARAGLRVTAAVIASLLLLSGISFGLIRMLALA